MSYGRELMGGRYEELDEEERDEYLGELLDLWYDDYKDSQIEELNG